MKRNEPIRKLVTALMRAGSEHGVPNSFTPGELHASYGGPPPLTAGLVLRHQCAEIRRLLRLQGLEIAAVERRRVEGVTHTYIQLDRV